MTWTWAAWGHAALWAITCVFFAVVIGWVTHAAADTITSWRNATRIIGWTRAEQQLPGQLHAAAEQAIPDRECTWCDDLTRPGDPRNCTCDYFCRDWCNAGGWATTLIPAYKDDQP